MAALISKFRLSLSWRSIYAFVVVWLATFALLSPCNRQGTPALRTIANVRFTLNADASMPQDELQALLRGVVRQVTQPESVSQICDHLPKPFQPNPLLESRDIDLIKQRLSICQIPDDKLVSVAIAFEGKGGVDEVEFVNRLANRLALEIPRRTEFDRFGRWVRTHTQALDLSKQIHLAEQIRAEVAQLNETIVRIREQATAEQENPVVALPVQVNPATSEDLGDSVKNRFYQASTKTESKEADEAIRVAELLQTLDLSPIGVAATQLKTHAEMVHDLKQDMNAAIQDQDHFAVEPLGKLSAIQYAGKPVLQPSSKSTPLWLFMAPGLVGACVSLMYNPVRDRMQLQSLDDVARSMRIEIVGELPGESPLPAAKRSERWSATAVACSEYSLIAIGGLLLVACLMKPQLMAVALANPMVTLSNWFWLIMG